LLRDTLHFRLRLRQFRLHIGQHQIIHRSYRMLA
jgi:hypothetical protein